VIEIATGVSAFAGVSVVRDLRRVEMAPGVVVFAGVCSS